MSTLDAVPSISFEITCPWHPNTKSIDLDHTVGTALGDGVVYVVVEGFVLFSDPMVVSQFSHMVWMDMDAQTGCSRRFLRDERIPKGTGTADKSNPAYVKYLAEYTGHIYKHYEEQRGAQLANLDGRSYVRVDSARDKEAVADSVLQHLKAEGVPIA